MSYIVLNFLFTDDKEWKQVRDVKDLIAGPKQKAVIYKDQLLIIDWNYSRTSVDIQYFSLGIIIEI